MLITVFKITSCIDPYKPEIKGYESLLVVDALVTDANSSYQVKLSRTFNDQNDHALPVSDATVFISDENENIHYFQNSGEGFYKSDSSSFKGSPGNDYILHIQTSDDNEYESEKCHMYSVPEIDSIYYGKDQDSGNNGTQNLQGIRIYIDSKEAKRDQYLRWEYEEAWKFKIPFPKLFTYINDKNIYPIPIENEFCWKSNRSNSIIISSDNQSIIRNPVAFIASDQSDRLLIRYSILVKQYSLSPDEYSYWDNLRKTAEAGSDIFGTQPFIVLSNIHNVNNINEKVLGYFQVSAISKKRLFISLTDLAGLQLPFSKSSCSYLAVDPFSLRIHNSSWDELYSIFCATSDYYFIEPQYDIQGQLYKLVFTRPECADCTLTGSSKKPDFWQE